MQPIKTEHGGSGEESADADRDVVGCNVDYRV